tara:strand:- start:538 stop:735 length:198 start_codon:yes stop_codon:yes gene_type:complete
VVGIAARTVTVIADGPILHAVIVFILKTLPLRLCEAIIVFSVLSVKFSDLPKIEVAAAMFGFAIY